MVISALAFLASTYQTAQASEPPALWPISCFTYRDIDKSGTFNMPDRPYAGLTMEIVRPDSSVMRNESNIGGFSNFQLGLGEFKDNVLYMAGTYKVRPIVPQDWKISDPDPIEQELIAVENNIAGGGLGLIKPCAHTGLIAKLVIRGSVVPPENVNVADLTLTATNGSNYPIQISSNDRGKFQFEGEPGKWTIRVTSKSSGKSVTRAFEINSDNMVLSKIDFGVSDAHERSSIPVKVQFDDITPSDTLYEIPSGYNGLNWLYWVNTHQKFYQGYGYVNANTSGEYVAYNSSGLPASIWRDEPFDFVGTYVTAAWQRGEEYPVTVKAWRGDALVYEDQFYISTSGPVYFDANYLNINRMEFSHESYERLVIDDFIYRP